MTLKNIGTLCFFGRLLSWNVFTQPNLTSDSTPLGITTRTRAQTPSKLKPELELELNSTGWNSRTSRTRTQPTRCGPELESNMIEQYSDSNPSGVHTRCAPFSHCLHDLAPRCVAHCVAQARLRQSILERAEDDEQQNPRERRRRQPDMVELSDSNLPKRFGILGWFGWGAFQMNMSQMSHVVFGTSWYLPNAHCSRWSFPGLTFFEFGCATHREAISRGNWGHWSHLEPTHWRSLEPLFEDFEVLELFTLGARMCQVHFFYCLLILGLHIRGLNRPSKDE